MLIINLPRFLEVRCRNSAVVSKTGKIHIVFGLLALSLGPTHFVNVCTNDTIYQCVQITPKILLLNGCNCGLLDKASHVPNYSLVPIKILIYARITFIL